MFPYNQYISEYQYEEIDFPWTVLIQTTNKDDNQILDRRFSFLKFYPFSRKKIIQKPLYNSDSKVSDFYYLNERSVDNINFYSRYTWTINNSKNAEGDYIDEEWLFNKFRGWEKTTFNYTQIGKYQPVNLGFIEWGFLDDIVINPKMSTINVSNPIDLNLNLRFSIKTSTVTIDSSSLLSIKNEDQEISYSVTRKIVGRNVEYIIPLGDLAYSLEVRHLKGEVKCYWTDFQGEVEEPISEGIHFIKNTHLKVIIPNLETIKPTLLGGINNFNSSKLCPTPCSEIYESPGFLDIIVYGYNVLETVNLTNPRFVDRVYELYEDDVEIDLTDPWPNYPKLPLNLQKYLT